MTTLVGGALRAVVLVLLAVASLRVAVWLLDGNDPSSDADIGVGLVPIAVAVLVSGGWGYVDGRRHTASDVRGWWTIAALLCGVAAVIRSLDSVTDAVLLGVMAAVLVGLPAYVASAAARSHGPSVDVPGRR